MHACSWEVEEEGPSEEDDSDVSQPALSGSQSAMVQSSDAVTMRSTSLLFCSAAWRKRACAAALFDGSDIVAAAVAVAVAVAVDADAGATPAGS